MSVIKKVADALTFSRVLIALALIWLGHAHLTIGLPLACLLLMLSWTTDVLDGGLARLDKHRQPTWIGEHDLHIDMGVAIGALAYLALSGEIGQGVSLIYIAVWIGIFGMFGLRASLGKLFQAPVYGSLVWIALRDAPIFGWSMVGWILVALLVTWPRFPQQVVPSFLSGWGRIGSPKAAHDKHQGSQGGILPGSESPHSP